MYICTPTMPTLIAFMAIIDGQPRWSSVFFPPQQHTVATLLLPLVACNCSRVCFWTNYVFLYFFFCFPSPTYYLSLFPFEFGWRIFSFVGNWVPAVIIWSPVQLITDRWNVEHCIALTLEVAMRSKSVCQLCCPHWCWGKIIFYLLVYLYLRCWLIDRHKLTIAIKLYKQYVWKRVYKLI